MNYVLREQIKDNGMNYTLEKKMKDVARTACSCVRGMRKVTKFPEDRMSVRPDCSSI